MTRRRLEGSAFQKGHTQKMGRAFLYTWVAVARALEAAARALGCRQGAKRAHSTPGHQAEAREASGSRQQAAGSGHSRTCLGGGGEGLGGGGG